MVRAGVIAGAYVALCLLLAPFSYKVVQVRVAESLTVLPILWAEAVPGLAVGVLVANFVGPFGWVDVIFGTLATLLAAVLTRKYRRSWVAYAFPIVVNGVVVGGYLPFISGLAIHTWTVPAAMASVAAGEAVAVILFGVPLVHALRRMLAPR
jgi:uncharacterized membrane protein